MSISIPGDLPLESGQSSNGHDRPSPTGQSGPAQNREDTIDGWRIERLSTASLSGVATPVTNAAFNDLHPLVSSLLSEELAERAIRLVRIVNEDPQVYRWIKPGTDGKVFFGSFLRPDARIDRPVEFTPADLDKKLQLQAAWQMLAYVTAQYHLLDIKASLGTVTAKIGSIRTILVSQEIGKIRSWNQQMVDYLRSLDANPDTARLAVMESSLESIASESRALFEAQRVRLSSGQASALSKPWFKHITGGMALGGGAGFKIGQKVGGPAAAIGGIAGAAIGLVGGGVMAFKNDSSESILREQLEEHMDYVNVSIQALLTQFRAVLLTSYLQRERGTFTQYVVTVKPPDSQVLGNGARIFSAWERSKKYSPSSSRSRSRTASCVNRWRT